MSGNLRRRSAASRSTIFEPTLRSRLAGRPRQTMVVRATSKCRANRAGRFVYCSSNTRRISGGRNFLGTINPSIITRSFNGLFSRMCWVENSSS